METSKFIIIHRLKDITSYFRHIPADIVDDGESVDIIREQGLPFISKPKGHEELRFLFMVQPCPGSDLGKYRKMIQGIRQSLRIDRRFASRFRPWQISLGIPCS